MSVAIIPMLSASARSMFQCSATLPRKMFPPPTTMATWMPRSRTASTSVQIWSRASGSNPKVLLPAIAPPESLSMIRL